MRKTDNKRIKKVMICEMLISALVNIKQSKKEREDTGGPGKAF